MLRDGSTAHLRPITPKDAQALQEMHRQQSEASVYLRYFTYKSQLTPKELERFTNVDHTSRVAFVVLRGAKVIGVGGYDRLDDPTEAEVAFNVSDEYHGSGIASILLEHLAAAGRENGIEKFTAEVLPENRKMLTVFSEAGYAVARHFEDGVVMLVFPIDPTDKSRSVMEAREHRAEAKSVAGLLAPASVAVIGASRSWGTLGYDVLNRLVESGFTGALYAVNEQAFEIGGLPRYGGVTEVAGPLDLGIICVPMGRVLGVVDDGAAHGVKGLLVMTAGYESDQGLREQRELITRARINGMRVIGPASLGLQNTDPDVQLNASVAQQLPAPGNIGFFSQSAAMGVLLHGVQAQRGLGLSSAISAGLRADVSGNDAMQYFEDDEHTAVVAMHLESFGNPRKFSRIARRLSGSKPVIVAKSDVMGLRLPPGHSVRTSQAPPAALNAVLAQAGVIRVGSVEQLMDVASVLCTSPAPAGPNLTVLSNSLTLAEVTCDVAVSRTLSAAADERELDFSLGQSRALPLLRERVQQLVQDATVHSVIIALLPVPGISDNALLGELGRFAGCGKPVLVVLSGRSDRSIGTGVHHGLPVFTSPAAAVRALDKAHGYRQWLNVEHDALPEPEGIDADGAEDYLKTLTAQIPGTTLRELDYDQASTLLAHYGIPVLESQAVNSADEAVAAAHRLGWPVALKADDPYLRQRLDLGGVRLNITDEPTLRANYAHMFQAMGQWGVQALEVQSMAEAGQACVIRAVEDPLLGPVISFGLSGDPVNLLDDWAHGVAPLSVQDLEDLIHRPRSSARLFGYQGLPQVDLAALKDLLNRVALLKDNHPEVAILKISPVTVSEHGLSVLAAEVQVGNPEQRTDTVRRALRG